jgi:hypothetical protein
MTWAAVGVAGVGAAGSIIGGGKASKKAASAQKDAINQQREAAAYQQMWTQQNRDAQNAMNTQNAATNNASNLAMGGAANDMSRGNMDWANQQNIANAQQQLGMNRSNQDYAQAQNWESQLKAQGLNQQAIDNQTASNRLNTTNAFGGGVTYNPDGSVSQTLGAGDQGLMDTYNTKANEIMGGMGGGFDVNGDVMNAYRAVNQPLVDQQRNQENARLAAMGLATGSGSAWGSAQDALNRNQVNSDQNAILQGFNADQALRSSNRADLGALGGVRSGIQAGLAQPDYWKQGNYAQITAPSQQAVNSQIANVSGWQTPIQSAQIAQIGGAQTPDLNPTAAQNYGQATGQAVQNQWNGIGQAGGDAVSAILGGKNTQQTPTLAQQGAADFTNGWNSSNYG